MIPQSHIAPTATIFLPRKDGISHNEIEDAEAVHLEVGCNVLLRVMMQEAGVAAAAAEQATIGAEP